MVMRSRAAFRLCADVKHAAFLPRLKPVDEGVFHQRLQQHFEHRDPGSRSRDIIQRCDALAKARLLDADIESHDVDLLCEGHERVALAV